MQHQLSLLGRVVLAPLEIARGAYRRQTAEGGWALGASPWPEKVCGRDGWEAESLCQGLFKDGRSGGHGKGLALSGERLADCCRETKGD